MPKRQTSIAEPQSARTLQRPKLFALEPWGYRVSEDRKTAVVEAYVETAGARQDIAHIPQSRWIDAEATAQYIAGAVNALHNHDATVGELCAALELCLESNGLTWEAEFEAEGALRRVKEGKAGR